MSSIKLGSPVVVKLDHRFAKKGVLRAAIVNAVFRQGDVVSYDLTVFLQVNDMASRHAPSTVLLHGAQEGTKEGNCQLVGSTWPTPAAAAVITKKSPPVHVADDAKADEKDPTVMVAGAPAVAAVPAQEAAEDQLTE